MHICIIGKYPPIQGGVSTQNYWISRYLARQGHKVHVVTNANEVESNFRIHLDPEDQYWYQPNYNKGWVRVWNTENLTSKYHYVPKANPFVTKLASIAMKVVESYPVDVIFSYYLEPYSVAAYLVSSWTGVPFIVKHAGSDVGRLLKISQLHETYKEILRRANLVVTSRRLVDYFLSLGVDSSKIALNPGFSLPPEQFNPDVEPINLNRFLDEKVEFSLINYQSSDICSTKYCKKPIDPATPSIGIYGKIGENKGSFDIIYALSKLKQKNVKFNFIAVTHGLSDDEKKFHKIIVNENLIEQTRILPFMPNWKIPGFLKSLTGVCFLERKFPIEFHNPIIPMEVLSCGTCLIVSKEIAMKQPFCEKMIHGLNVLIVRDPQDHNELAEVLQKIIENPKLAHEIGKKGTILTKGLLNPQKCVEEYTKLLQKVFSMPETLRNSENFFIKEKQDNRFFLRFFPLTAHLLGGQIDLVIDYLKSEAEKSDEKKDCVYSPMQFYAIVVFLLNKRIIKSPYLEDIILWELYQAPWENDAIEKMTQTQNELFFRYNQIPCKKLNQRVVINLIPSKLDNIFIRKFKYDMEKLTRQVKEKRFVESGLKEKQSFYLFQRFHPVSQRTRIIQVSPEVYFLLQLCDGHRTVKEIIKIFNQNYLRKKSSINGIFTDIISRSIIAQFYEGLILFKDSKVNNSKS